MTKSVTLTCCAPLILVGARYYYSRKVIQSYLDCALHTDMADIETYYMTPTGKTSTDRLTVFLCRLGDAPAPEGFCCSFWLNIQKFYRELIKYRSPLFFPSHPPSSSLSFLSPHLPPLTSSLNSHQSWGGWDGGGLVGRSRDGVHRCYWLQLLMRSERLVSSGRNLDSECHRSSSSRRRCTPQAPRTRLDTAGTKDRC